MEEGTWTLLDPFLNPPNLKSTWKAEQQTMRLWKNFVFCQLGDSNLYDAFPFSVFHPPRPLTEPTTEVALEHPFLNPEKAMDVDKWVGLAEDEVDHSSVICSPGGIGQLETSGLRTPSVIPPTPVIQQRVISKPEKAPIPGIKKRMPLILEKSDDQLTTSSVVRQDDPPSALLIPSLGTERPKDIEVETEDKSSSDSTRLDPTPISKSSQVSQVVLELPKLQTTRTAIPEGSTDNIIKEQVPAETTTVVSVASKNDLSDLIDFSWKSETEIESDLPVSPEMQLESLKSPTKLLIPDLESDEEESEASKLEAQRSKDFLSLDPVSQTFTSSELTDDQTTPSSGDLLLEPGVSALSGLGNSQNFNDLLSLTSETEAAILTGYSPRGPPTDASRGDQTEYEELLTDIEDTGHLEQAPEAAAEAPDQTPELLHSSPLIVARCLVSPGASSSALPSVSTARRYLLTLFPKDGNSDQAKPPFDTDGSFDNVPQLELPQPHTPPLAANSLQGEKTYGGNVSLLVNPDTREFHSLMKQKSSNIGVNPKRGNPGELRKTYAQAAGDRSRVNQRAMLDNLAFKEKENVQPSLQPAPALPPRKKEIPNAHTEQVNSLFAVLKRILDPLTCWPGLLKLEVAIGIMLLPGGPKKSGSGMELDRLKRLMAPPGLAAPSVTLFDRLTVCPGDMDYLVDLVDPHYGVNGLRLFEKDSLYAKVEFEFHCERGPSKFIVTVFENGSHKIKRPEALLGALYLNFPSSIWDAAVKIRGEINRPEENEEVKEAALFIAKNLWIEPNRSLVRLLTRRPKNLKIVKILMKRSTEHQHWKSEYPEEGSEENMYLRVRETQDLIIQVTDLDDEVIQAHCDPLPEMTKANRQWWSASVFSPILNTYLASNKHIEPGEKTTDWTTADLFGSDAKFLVPSEPSTATATATSSSAPARPSAVATTIGGAGISGLVRLAEKVVRKIDAVGWNNQGPASGLKNGSSTTSRGAGPVSVAGEKQRGVSLFDLLARPPLGTGPMLIPEVVVEDKKKEEVEFW